MSLNVSEFSYLRLPNSINSNVNTILVILSIGAIT